MVFSPLFLVKKGKKHFISCWLLMLHFIIFQLCLGGITHFIVWTWTSWNWTFHVHSCMPTHEERRHFKALQAKLNSSTLCSLYIVFCSIEPKAFVQNSRKSSDFGQAASNKIDNFLLMPWEQHFQIYLFLHFNLNSFSLVSETFNWFSFVLLPLNKCSNSTEVPVALSFFCVCVFY